MKVVYVAGYGRSGSTLLDNILGEIPGFFAAGELNHIWDRDLLDRRPCGCGEHVLRCEVWAPVLRRVFGRDPEPGDLDEVMDAQRQMWRVTETWRILRAAAPSAAVARYADFTSRIYSAIGTVTGSHTVVDSSKRPSLAAMLPHVAEADPYVVQLVRDPRAIAFSWQRRKDELGTHTATYSTTRWLSWNLATDSVRKGMTGERSMLVRYEDFVTSPRAVISDLLTMAREDPGESPVGDDQTVTTGPNHAVAGNPNRFRTGAIKLRLDDEWRGKLSLRDRTVATAIALPLLRRYGYPVRTRP